MAKPNAPKYYVPRNASSRSVGAILPPPSTQQAGPQPLSCSPGKATPEASAHLSQVTGEPLIHSKLPWAPHTTPASLYGSEETGINPAVGQTCTQGQLQFVGNSKTSKPANIPVLGSSGLSQVSLDQPFTSTHGPPCSPRDNPAACSMLSPAEEGN